MTEMKTNDMLVSFAAALIVTFLVGAVIGAVVGMVVMILVYTAREPKVFPAEYFLGGGLGLIVGAILAMTFTVALF